TPNIDVFFDNLHVTHVRGPLIEEAHYYPFGLTMAGISSKALNFGEPENNAKKFQGQEYNGNLGINIYEFKYRMDDPQIGRFWQIDPLADKYVHNSTYAFSENKVIAHVELEGLEKVLAIGGAFNHHHKKDISTITLDRNNVTTPQTTTDYSETKTLPETNSKLIKLVSKDGGGIPNPIKSVSETVNKISSQITEVEGVGKVLATTSVSETTTVSLDMTQHNGITKIAMSATTTTSFTKIVVDDPANNRVSVSIEPGNNSSISTTTSKNLPLDPRYSNNLNKLSSELENRVNQAVQENTGTFKSTLKQIEKNVSQ